MTQTRVLIVRRGCGHCREAQKVVHWINLRLPLNKQIKIFDNFRWEEFGLREHAIAEKFTEAEGFDGYPFLYLDGITVGQSQKLLLLSFLQGYLEKELIF